MTNALPQEGPERQLLVTALVAYSDDCDAPALTPECPFYVETSSGPSCAEECKDILAKVQGDEFANPTFEAPDGLPVNQLFFVLVPEKATEAHLQILAALAEMFADDKMRERLSSLSDAHSIHQELINFRADANPHA